MTEEEIQAVMDRIHALLEGYTSNNEAVRIASQICVSINLFILAHEAARVLFPISVGSVEPLQRRCPLSTNCEALGHPC